MKAVARYIAALCREEADNDDLFLCLGTVFVFLGLSLVSLPLAIIFVGIVFLVLAYLSALPPKQPIVNGEP